MRLPLLLLATVISTPAFSAVEANHNTVVANFHEEASLYQFLMPHYYLGGLVRGILNLASRVGYHQYDVIQNPSALKRAESALSSIYSNAAFDYLFTEVKITMIRGLPDEPNAFGFGANIFITQSLINLLNDQELTAVIAHELAHIEKVHFLQKVPLPLEALAYQLKNVSKAVQERKWPHSKDLLESIRELMETGGLALELQADCIAAQQLDFMSRRGLQNEPMDLVRATNKVLGVDTTLDQSDNPSAERTRAIINKNYLNWSCDIFFGN